MRQSLASSTQARMSWPGILLELRLEPLEQREGVGGGAGEAGDHLALAERADLLALCFITVWPSETWPSPAITTLPPLRTERMVVPCQARGLLAHEGPYSGPTPAFDPSAGYDARSSCRRLR